MRLIAWDTSAKCGSIVAVEGSLLAPNPPALRLVAELSFQVNMSHSEGLLWGIHQVLTGSGWSLDDLHGIGVGSGPGSFTGVRIGLTTARTLAHALNKPLIGVSSLAVLARPAALHFAKTGPADPVQKLENPVCVVAATDACKGELFALFGEANAVSRCSVDFMRNEGQAEGLSLWNTTVFEKVLSPMSLVEAIQAILLKNRKSRWVVVGEGRQRYLEDWKKLPEDREWKCPSIFPDQVQGRYLGQLVWEAYLGHAGGKALEVYPRYLRASDAEIQLKAGTLRVAPVLAD